MRSSNFFLFQGCKTERRTCYQVTDSTRALHYQVVDIYSRWLPVKPITTFKKWSQLQAHVDPNVLENSRLF